MGSKNSRPDSDRSTHTTHSTSAQGARGNRDIPSIPIAVFCLLGLQSILGLALTKLTVCLAHHDMLSNLIFAVIHWF